MHHSKSLLLALFVLLASSLPLKASAESVVVIHDGDSVTVHGGLTKVEYDEEDDEECPAGFEESEDKCTPEEREEGCRDIRLDNGKGCVSR